MKKLLMSILIALLLLLSIFLIIQGIEIGNFAIPGIRTIKAKSEELDAKIQEAAKLTEKDYRQIENDVEENTKKLKQEKQNYEDIIAIAGDGENAAGNQLEKYEIETLWVRIGNHATSEGVVMQMDVLRGTNNTEGVFNLKFTATGSYISITDFISDIENDSTLGFKIEEFKMIPNNSKDADLKATFICKDIAIKDVSAIQVKTERNEEEQNQEQNQNDENKTNTTNTTENNTNNNNVNNSANTTNNTSNTNNSNNTNTAQ